MIVVAVTVAALGASALLWFSGSVRARVSWPSDRGNYGDTWNQASKQFATDILIRNDGWSSIRIVGVGQDEPGVRLIAASGISETHPEGARILPFTLNPGESAAVTIAYQITDCTAVPVGKLPIQVRVDRWWGTQSVSVTHPEYYEVGDKVSTIGPGSGSVEWQRAMADRACGMPG